MEKVKFTELKEHWKIQHFKFYNFENQSFRGLQLYHELT
jgi:hypothetical protein